MQKRSPRFHRVAVEPFQFTPRDCDIIIQLYRHRFLRSDQIWRLVGGSHQQTLRRLRLLYHHGYVERPLVQIHSYLRSGSTRLIYGLGKESERILRDKLGVAVGTTEKDLAVSQPFIEHTLMVADVMIAIELACRARDGVRLLYDDELALPVERKPFQWHVTERGGEKLGVTPDRVFALEFIKDGQTERAHFFLEADRGTMPVKRHSLAQTSVARKLLAYSETWDQGIHQSKLGINRFRVLTVTESPKRLESIVAACRELKRGQGLFLFADASVIAGDPLAFAWRTAAPHISGEMLS